jgi:alkanesulfonate monooxygenase SsuD/methylene tetrahydromethanopterin reductase-like flavin-dependent oxidoreductase (luciferase family)
MFTMRFDMRAPVFGAAPADLYETALEMAAWGEANGCMAVQVSEHHRSSDGYLPSPLILASAIAARTRTLPIQVAALVLPLHDPVDIAEQMVVLDLVSRGRVSYVMVVGYVPAEYAMFGRDMKGRGKRIEECLDVIQAAFRGEEFEYEGRPVHVTPAPFTPGGPFLFMGGGSAVVARRAARYGMGVLAMGGNPELESIYLDACKEYGKTPGMFIDPEPGQPNSAFVARDPDAAWKEWGPHLLHDAMGYAEWMGDDIESATKSQSMTVEALRAEEGNYRIFSPEEAIAEIETRGRIQMQPLCGGLPPEMAWESLKTLVSDVLPNVKSSTGRIPPTAST